MTDAEFSAHPPVCSAGHPRCVRSAAIPEGAGRHSCRTGPDAADGGDGLSGFNVCKHTRSGQCPEILPLALPETAVGSNKITSNSI